MTVNPDDPALIALGAAISDGAQVDWDRVQQDANSPEAAQMVAEMRHLQQLVTAVRSAGASRPEGEAAAALHVRTWRHLVLFEAVGSGAFGTVYRAWDSQLEREVAVKLLPKSGSAGSPLAEARNLARIRHGNVVTVYGTDQDHEYAGIWMEFIEGQTLAAMVRDRGPMSPREVTGIGIDLCHALSSLHAAGLVHRDIKPHNVMRETGGRIVLMDFSGAEAVVPEMVSTAFSGTPLFMAPELLDGEDARPATDAYSLGILLFFLLTGTVPVEGGTIGELKAAHREKRRKRLRDLRPDLPDAVVQVVERATTPDPDVRYQTAGELEHALAGASGSWIASLPSLERSWLGTLQMFGHSGWRGGLLIGATGVLIAAAVVALAPRQAPVIVGQPGAHFTVGPPYTTGSWPRISPDGRFVTFGTVVEGRNRFWIRRLDSLEGRPLLNTAAAETPFWSPDGNMLAFFDAGKLKKISVYGGEPQELAAAPHPHGGDWQGSWLLFSTERSINRIAADGSQLFAVTALDPSRGDYQHTWPEFLPDGRRFLFIIRSTQPERSGVYLTSIDGGAPVRIMPADSRVAYAAGYLLFVRGGTLLAQPFDASRATITGAPVPLAARVKHHPASDAAFDVSASGVLVYSQEAGEVLSRLTLFDRRGREMQTLAATGSYRQPRFSPDGRRVAAEKLVPQRNSSDVWIYRVDNASAVRLTNNDAADIRPVWSPDGRRIAFSSKRGSAFEVFSKIVDSTAPETPLVNAPGDKLLEHWSSDGRYLVGTLVRSGLWILPLATGEPPRRVRAGETAESWQAEFSPDTRWLAYMSEESGSPEVYVEPFPATGARWQVSPRGGAEPHWSGDGKEFFFLSADGTLMVIPASGPQWHQARPTPLFRVSVPDLTGCLDYAVAPDGQTFVVNVFVSDPVVPPIDVVTNWTSLLVK
jgi:eukaryotic-like serine/threonine-protein kinase